MRGPRAGNSCLSTLLVRGAAAACAVRAHRRTRTTARALDVRARTAGGSSVARAWSGYVDSLAGGAISTYLNDTVGHWHVSGLAAYPDFLAFGMTLFLSVICSIGVRESTIINNALTVTNVAVILFVCIAGAFFVDKQNFTPFAPFGVSGIFTGAATAFFSYVGFDVIATSAEEAKNPQRNIPIAIVTSLILCMLCYSAVSIVVCLMVPYYNLDPTAPLSKAFSATSAKWAGVVIAVGAVAGLSTSLMTCIFPMPRIIYAIASDGLLPAWLGRVHPRFNTPLVATMLCGTLLSYTLVSGSVLVLRYREHDARVEQARRKLLDDEAALHHHYDATQDQPLMG
ncbi:amino acid permease, partial [archaeon]